MAKKNKTSNWIKKHTSDPFVKKSQNDRYRSRAAYKLISINDKYNILKNISSVVDLGCAPGSWLQVIKEHKNIKHIIGIDLLDLDAIEGVMIHNQDIRDLVSVNGIFIDKDIPIDLVLSDIAPNITGIRDIDQSNFSEIALNIIDFCRSHLRPKGTMIMKYFLGSGFDETHNKLNNYFKKISVFKPASSKKNSNEVYLICIDFKD